MTSSPVEVLRQRLAETAEAIRGEIVAPTGQLDALMARADEVRALLTEAADLSARLSRAAFGEARPVEPVAPAAPSIEHHGEWWPHDLRRPLLQTLVELGGRGDRKEVMERVRALIEPTLTATDREILTMSNGQHAPTRMPRWKIRLYTTRQDLVRAGLLGYGRSARIWKITKRGLEYLEATR